MFARELALREEATLTALFASAPAGVDLPYAYAAGAVSADLAQNLHTQRLARAMTLFDEARASRPGEVAWAELHGEPVVEGVAEQALYADLLVLGQQDRSDPLAQELPSDFVESVLIVSGRPALVLPYAGRFDRLGETVLLAWKPSAPAARALAAALPLLRRAKAVHAVSWGQPSAPRCQGDRLDLERYLGLHGVAATLHGYRDEPRDVGEALLSAAADFGADLMVMGCYGHSRARELVLGGASRSVLGAMTLPTLMCH
jgi:nucleotide-binding universal stress UspA family protein